jgi:hypothetical protein
MISVPSIPEDPFPASEVFVDCCGRSREFDLELLDIGRGCFVRATERVAGNDGYAFAAHSETDPWLALGRLRDKIREGLATRYLVEGQHPPSLTHDVVAGHITYGGIVVDGRQLGFDELTTLLSSYEGWHFTLKIVDGYGAS